MLKPKHIPVLLMLMSIMPYLSGGMRIEHIILPPMALIAALYALQKKGSLHVAPAAIALLALTASLVALVLGSALSELTGSATSSINMFVRLLMPMLMLAAFPYALAQTPLPLMSVAKAIVGTAIVASFFTLASVFFDIASILSLWVRTEDEAVWTQAIAIGRFTGLFNQPLEAGVFFSVALFAQLYLFKVRTQYRVFNIIGLLAICIGGFLSLSKNFTILGIAFALGFSTSINLLTLRAAFLLLVVCGSGISTLVLKLNAIYADSFINLFEEGGLLLALTAGRLGSADTEVSQLFAQLWGQGHWFFGRGLGSQLPLDNGYLEFFYQGGIFAFVGYLIFLATLSIYAVMRRQYIEGKLMMYLLLFIIGSSFGGPVISANRANVALMLLIAACIVSIRIHTIVKRSTH
jgi:hypothetical protein